MNKIYLEKLSFQGEIVSWQGSPILLDETFNQGNFFCLTLIPKH